MDLVIDQVPETLPVLGVGCMLPKTTLCMSVREGLFSKFTVEDDPRMAI